MQGDSLKRKPRGMKKKGAVMGLLLIFVTILSGCSIGSYQVYFSGSCGFHTIFEIGSLKCPENEARVYLANYKNIYGTIDGSSLWTDRFDTAQMESSIKDAVAEHLSKVYALDLYAKEHHMVLTKEEEEKTQEAAKTYAASLNTAEKKYLKVSEKDICQMYQNYALAEKVYSKLMGSVDEEVSEDEARIMDAQVFYVTQKDKAAQIAAQLKAGTSFDTLATANNESGKDITVSFGRGTYSSKVEEVAFSLQNNETAGPVSDGKGHYYFIKCMNKYNEDLSEKNKSVVIKKRQSTLIKKIIADLDKRYYSEFNKKLWNNVKIDTDKEIQTDSFFSTLDQKVNFGE